MLPLSSPPEDPTALFEIYRGHYGSELLISAIHHFKIFEKMGDESVAFKDLQQLLQLQRRPARVLTTALASFGLLKTSDGKNWTATPLARKFLIPPSPFNISSYIGLSSDHPGVKEMIRLLENNTPASVKTQTGTAFIFREGLESAMEEQEAARNLTNALAGRARIVAPALAKSISLPGRKLLLDLGGGTGIYSLALLQSHPELKAIIFDRPEVLKVAWEYAAEFDAGDRIKLFAGDMFGDPFPECDIILLSNVLHDWDERQCEALIAKCAQSLKPGDELYIHDVFLNDNLDGPLPVSLYSAALFSITEGRAYSFLEYKTWLEKADFTAEIPVSTGVHCGVIRALRR